MLDGARYTPHPRDFDSNDDDDDLEGSPFRDGSSGAILSACVDPFRSDVGSKWLLPANEEESKAADPSAATMYPLDADDADDSTWPTVECADDEVPLARAEAVVVARSDPSRPPSAC
jgi:hypothetical protein